MFHSKLLFYLFSLASFLSFVMYTLLVLDVKTYLSRALKLIWTAFFLLLLWLFISSLIFLCACVIICAVRKLMDHSGNVMCRRNHVPRRGTLLLSSLSALLCLKRKGWGSLLNSTLIIMCLLIMLSWYDFTPLYVFSLRIRTTFWCPYAETGQQRHGLRN